LIPQFDGALFSKQWKVRDRRFFGRDAALKRPFSVGTPEA
jgi:hypothetical protein